MPRNSLALVDAMQRDVVAAQGLPVRPLHPEGDLLVGDVAARRARFGPVSSYPSARVTPSDAPLSVVRRRECDLGPEPVETEGQRRHSHFLAKAVSLELAPEPRSGLELPQHGEVDGEDVRSTDDAPSTITAHNNRNDSGDVWARAPQ